MTQLRHWPTARMPLRGCSRNSILTKSIFGYSYDYRLIHQSYNQAGYQLYLVKIWPRGHEGFDKLIPYDFKAHPDDAAGAFVAKNDCKDDSPLYLVREYTIYLHEQAGLNPPNMFMLSSANNERLAFINPQNS